MAVARKCDVCGKFYEPYGTKRGEKNGIRFTRIDEDYYINDYPVIDCCKECLNAIEEFIENRKEK